MKSKSYHCAFMSKAFLRHCSSFSVFLLFCLFNETYSFSHSPNMRIPTNQMKQLIRYRQSGHNLWRKSHLRLSQSPQIVSYTNPIMDNVLPSPISPILPLHKTNIQQSSTSTKPPSESAGTEIKVEPISFDNGTAEVEPKKERFYDHIFLSIFQKENALGSSCP